MRKLINWGPWSEPSMTMLALTDTALTDELAVDIDQMLVDAFAAKPTPIEAEVDDITAKAEITDKPAPQRRRGKEVVAA